MTKLERDELKALSLEILGGEHKWRMMLKGVKNQVKTPDGKDVTQNGVPVFKVVRKTEEDILSDLRLLKKDYEKKVQNAIKDAEGKNTV